MDNRKQPVRIFPIYEIKSAERFFGGSFVYFFRLRRRSCDLVFHLGPDYSQNAAGAGRDQQCPGTGTIVGERSHGISETQSDDRPDPPVSEPDFPDEPARRSCTQSRPKIIL